VPPSRRPASPSYRSRRGAGAEYGGQDHGDAQCGRRTAEVDLDNPFSEEDFAARMAECRERWERSGGTDLVALWLGLHFSGGVLQPWLGSGLLNVLMKQIQPTLQPTTSLRPN
jgi:hypothetical protein